MSNFKERAVRLSAFASSSLLSGTVLFFLTQNLIPLTALPDMAGLFFHTGFFISYFILSLNLARRYCMGTFELEYFSLFLGFLLVFPTLLFSLFFQVLDDFFGYLLFFLLLIISITSGSFLGILLGRRKRDKLIRKALETGEKQKNL